MSPLEGGRVTEKHAKQGRLGEFYSINQFQMLTSHVEAPHSYLSDHNPVPESNISSKSDSSSSFLNPVSGS